MSTPRGYIDQKLIDAARALKADIARLSAERAAAVDTGAAAKPVRRRSLFFAAKVDPIEDLQQKLQQMYQRNANLEQVISSLEANEQAKKDKAKQEQQKAEDAAKREAENAALCERLLGDPVIAVLCKLKPELNSAETTPARRLQAYLFGYDPSIKTNLNCFFDNVTLLEIRSDPSHFRKNIQASPQARWNDLVNEWLNNCELLYNDSHGLLRTYAALLAHERENSPLEFYLEMRSVLGQIKDIYSQMLASLTQIQSLNSSFYVSTTIIPKALQNILESDSKKITEVVGQVDQKVEELEKERRIAQNLQAFNKLTTSTTDNRPRAGSR